MRRGRSNLATTQSAPMQMDEQFMLLAAQSASVHERRRVLRERRHAALSIFVPNPSERWEEDSGCLSPGSSSEEPRSRFSHTSLPSTAEIHSPPKRRSLLARLMKAFVS